MSRMWIEKSHGLLPGVGGEKRKTLPRFFSLELNKTSQTVRFPSQSSHFPNSADIRVDILTLSPVPGDAQIGSFRCNEQDSPALIHPDCAGYSDRADLADGKFGVCFGRWWRWGNCAADATANASCF